MAETMEGLTAIGLAAEILTALDYGIRVQQRLTAAKRRSSPDIEEAVAKLKTGAARLNDGVVERFSSDAPVAAASCASSKLLENVAAEIAALPTEGQTNRSMLDRLKLTKKSSRIERHGMKETEMRLKEQVARLNELVSLSLQQDAENVLREIQLLPQITPAQVSIVQSVLSSLRAAISSLRDSSTSAYEAFQALAPQIKNLVAKMQQNAALDALKFGKLHERFDSITIAEANTYAWLLPDASDYSGQAPVLSEHLAVAKKTFLDWLEAGSEFLYTSGKPGAGKSTLMKFICRHPQFYDCAARWAGDATLVVGRFFFWKPGQSEQKSINGMLRGLLYSILETRADIAAVAMPELCDSLRTDKTAAVSDDDVKNAFQKMLNAFSQSKRYAVMLVIDGLDEFEGEHGDLLALMQSWVLQYPSTIKICVSSREYGIFEDFFAGCPKLRLHDLTKDDMALLIASRFNTSTAFAQLPGRDLGTLTPLMVERAEGVFLWVVLAISSLEDGMEGGDIKNAGELEGYVKRFPSELDEFLAHVHGSVSEYNRPWAYKAITLVHFAQFRVAELLASREGYPGVGLMDFMLMDEASSSWNLTMFSPRSDFKTATVEERLRLMRRKVLCRPKGFLAVSNLPNARTWPANGNGDDKLYITFTHRSVVEFLGSPSAVGMMATYIGSFDAFFALASSDLAALRFAPPTVYPLLKDKVDLPPGDSVELTELLADSFVRRIRELIECAKALEKGGSARFLSILDAIGDAIKRHLTLLLPLKRIRLAPEDNSPHQVLVNLTLANHIYEYSEWKRKQPMQNGGKKTMSSSLFRAFQAVIQRCRAASQPTVTIRGLEGGRPIRVINNTCLPSSSNTTAERLHKVFDEFLENGLDLNWSWHGTWHGTTTAAEDAWTCWQAILWATVIGDLAHEEKPGDILALLLKHGAASDVKIISETPKGPLEIEDLEPSEGWYLVSPFENATSKLDSKSQVGNTSGRDAMLPAVLMHESVPSFQWAKGRNWVLTFEDLVRLKSDNDTGNLDALLVEKD
ncbi:hypothetical protein LEL_03132 [Akanthomyces lecanii RCEF 1005]|uniref:NACHT domain-containing protein n=1 Tax=Akanthomyces lecanii RCEF 1005 TaxID=1081108 RepID=A0A168ITM1_CORDF|nr:hypothetical protein LEL_03132 [Akanthomyces lecanii RCEF 1005]